MRRGPKPRIPTCHPDRKHEAKGLCYACYQQQWNAANPERVHLKIQKYRENRAYRPAECHPERQEKARGLCAACYAKEWHAKHIATHREYVRNKRREYRLRAMGVPIDTPLECASCGATEPGRAGTQNFAIDHDHKTGAFRGLLCNACNLMIGMSQDSPERLEAAASYLRRVSNV